MFIIKSFGFAAQYSYEIKKDVLQNWQCLKYLFVMKKLFVSTLQTWLKKTSYNIAFFVGMVKEVEITNAIST